MLGFKHYAGQPCHQEVYTQAVPWPAKGPNLYTRAKVPLRDNYSYSQFPPSCSLEEAGLCLSLPLHLLSLPLLSISLALSVSLSFSLPSLLIKLHSQALSTLCACYPWWLWDATKVPLLPCLAHHGSTSMTSSVHVSGTERAQCSTAFHTCGFFLPFSSNWRSCVISTQIHLELHLLVV